MTYSHTCPRCRTAVSQGVQFCPACGFHLAPQNTYGVAPAKTYMVEAILVTLFCCLPFGIVAIINASQAENYKALGDYAASQTAADTAHKFIKWSLIGWAALVGVYLIFVVGVMCMSLR